jgi:phospho-N-acetylmuramoyl-pentapeptide-transferase
MLEITQTLQKSLIYLFISLGLSALIAPFIINILYKLKLTVLHKVNEDEKNKEFVAIHGWKSGTPNMGGLIILFVIPILSLILHIPGNKIGVFLLGFLGLGIYGFLDNLLVDISKDNNELRQLQDAFWFRLGKLLLMIFIGSLVGYVLYCSDTNAFSTMDLFGIVFDFKKWIVPIFGLLLSLAVYAFDIFDGADGLFSGTFIINCIGLILLLLVQNQLNFIPLIFIILGTLIVFLYFNIPPARVWMGASGAMPIAFTLFFIAFVTHNTIAFLIMSLMQWIVFGSSFIQIVAIRFFDTKIFKIAPLHHHFESEGWPEYKIVMRFWLFSLVFTLAGVLVGLYF